ncbi:hypothetical protein JCM5296_005747 [Sporobolomyces johnsonii]
MTTELPAPESPFPARPEPSSNASASPASGDAATPTASHAVSAKPLPVEFPLTSFASTPHNVSCIGFCLGACWFLGLSLAARAVSSKWFVWTPGAGAAVASELPQQGWATALSSPQLGMYLASWAWFHLLEFVVTSMYNPGKLSASSYLLDNGREYFAAHLAGLVEHVLEEVYLPPQYRVYKHSGGVFLLGLATVAVGQFLRSFAMICASSNFSHMHAVPLLAYRKLPSHQLVKTGIYAWSRHPSYAGFYWWAVGTQIMLGNPLCTILFVGVLQYFFSDRIRIEEVYLVRFFGKDYEDYRAKVPTRILFIR